MTWEMLYLMRVDGTQNHEILERFGRDFGQYLFEPSRLTWGKKTESESERRENDFPKAINKLVKV